MSAKDIKEYEFQPHVSGNPKGRPIGAKMGMRARLNRWIETRGEKTILEKFEEKGITLKDKDYAEIITYALTRAAVKGDIQAIKIIFEQTESPLPKEINLTGDMIVNIGEKDAGNL